VTDILDAGVPASDSLTIQPKEKEKPHPPPPALERLADAAPSIQICAEPYLLPSVLPPPIPLPPLVHTAAVVSKSPMAVNYTVDEYTTIPSDHLSHKVLVAIVPFEATISYITSPRKSPIAYLQVGTHLSARLGIELKPYLPVRRQEYE